MTNEQIEELKKLAEAATPGPWFVQHGDDDAHMNMTAIAAYDFSTRHVGQFRGDAALIAITFHQRAPLVGDQDDEFGEADSAFIAAANPVAIKELLSELTALRDKAFALDEWMDKTSWVQEQVSTFPIRMLGLHHADVMRAEIERLRAAASAAKAELPVKPWQERLRLCPAPADLTAAMEGEIADLRALMAEAMSPAPLELHRAVSDMTRMLSENEWAEHVSVHPAAAALESEITRLVGRVASTSAPKAELTDEQIYDFWMYRDCMDAIRAGDMKAQFVSAVRAVLAQAATVAPDLLRRACDVLEGLEGVELKGAMPARVAKLRAAVDAVEAAPVADVTSLTELREAVRLIVEGYNYGAGYYNEDSFVKGLEKLFIASGVYLEESTDKYVMPPSRTAASASSQPVAWMRFRAAQSWSGSGNHDIECSEWLEVCQPWEVGDDKLPAFPVYAVPAAPVAAAVPAGWVKNTGAQPVADDVLVVIVQEDDFTDAGRAGRYCWDIEGDGQDIIRYFVLPAAPAPDEASK